MSIFKRTLNSSQSKQNKSKQFIKDNSLFIHRSSLTEDNSMNTTDYRSTYLTQSIKTQNQHTSSFIRDKNAGRTTTTFSSIENNKTESSIKEPQSQSQLESLMTIMKEKVTKKMKDDYIRQAILYKSKTKSLSEAEITLNTTKNSLDESIHKVYNLFKDSTQNYYQKIRMNKENQHNVNEADQLKIRNEKMEKEIEALNKETRKRKADAVANSQDLQLASKRCKELSVIITNSIEDKKSLKTALLLTQLRMDKMKEVVSRYNKKEMNVVEQIKMIIKNYS